MVKKRDLEIVKKFKKSISKIMPVEKIILFGSRAKGKIHEWSDFDLVVVSDNFKGTVSFKRCLTICDSWDYDYPVDFLCYTSEEFDRLKNKITIVQHAVKEGIEI